MNRPHTSTTLQRVLCSWLIISVTMLSSPGCWLSSVFKSPWGNKPDCVLQPGISKTELVAHLNKNISPLMSWKSSDVHITTPGPGGIPTRLSATIAVESPKNFRLMVSSIAGREADFGSNNDRIWFWMKRVKRGQPRHVFTVSHDEIPRAQQRITIPFQPDWLMESLGVIPLDESAVTIQEDPSEAGIIVLISKQTTPSGEPVRRLIQVDSCRGYIIAHSLYTEKGELIAQATLNDYRVDEATGIALPHQIHLSGPQAGMRMTIKLGDVDVNPEYIPDSIWQIPKIPNSPEFDLAR